jgi:hypothetical protein
MLTSNSLTITFRYYRGVIFEQTVCCPNYVKLFVSRCHSEKKKAFMKYLGRESEMTTLLGVAVQNTKTTLAIV